MSKWIRPLLNKFQLSDRTDTAIDPCTKQNKKAGFGLKWSVSQLTREHTWAFVLFSLITISKPEKQCLEDNLQYPQLPPGAAAHTLWVNPLVSFSRLPELEEAQVNVWLLIRPLEVT